LGQGIAGRKPYKEKMRQLRRQIETNKNPRDIKKLEKILKQTKEAWKLKRNKMDVISCRL